MPACRAVPALRASCRPQAPRPLGLAAPCSPPAPQTACSAPHQQRWSVRRGKDKCKGLAKASTAGGRRQRRRRQAAMQAPQAIGAHLRVHGASQEGSAAPGGERRGSGRGSKPGAQGAQEEGTERRGAPHGRLNRAGRRKGGAEGRGPFSRRCPVRLPLLRDRGAAARSEHWPPAIGPPGGQGPALRRRRSQHSAPPLALCRILRQVIYKECTG